MANLGLGGSTVPVIFVRPSANLLGAFKKINLDELLLSALSIYSSLSGIVLKPNCFFSNDAVHMKVHTLHYCLSVQGNSIMINLALHSPLYIISAFFNVSAFLS